MKLSSFKGKLH